MKLEDHLNPEQIAAVTHGEGPQLVLAGAGSGKTRVITYRIAWLVDERRVDPGRISAVTFTNKAASEMRERVEELLGLYPLPTFVGTFHRFSLRLLRRWGDRVGLARDFAILDSTDQVNLVKQALATENLDERSFRPRSVLSAISGAKNKLIDPETYADRAQNFFEKKVAQLYRRYQGLLKSVSGVDFDDMISLAVRLLDEDEQVARRVRETTEHLLVDEYQDTNHAQLELIRRLVGEAGNITAVGDEDQGIYRWRGAEIQNILSFEKTFPGAEVRLLERNYRSTQNILDASGALVAHNKGRRGKRLWTDSGSGEALELFRAADEGDEARWLVGALKSFRGKEREDRAGDEKGEPLTFSDMAILVRTNAQTRALEEELLRQEVPYILVGGTRFYDRMEIKDLIAYLRVLRNPWDTFSMNRILNTPPRGIGKSTEALLQQVATERRMPVWDVLAQGELGEIPSRGAGALRAFAQLIQGLRKEARELPLPALLERLLEETGYAEMYESKKDAESEARLENIQEFLSAAQEFTEATGWRQEEGHEVDTLTAFLDHVSLVADVDSWQTERGVSIMTLHSAKGLEFPVVAVAGLEDGLLPHFNAQGTIEDLEEERRLLYVGMTRAKDRLILTTCQRRRVAGRYQDQLESRFLEELPGDLVSVTESPSLFGPRAAGSLDPVFTAGRRDPGGRGAASSTASDVYSFFGRQAPEGASSSSSSAASSAPSPPASLSRSPSSAARRPAPPSSGAAPGAGGDAYVAKRGDRVRHATLGEGKVLSVEGSGDQRKLTVYFDRAGRKKLLAKYANLHLE